MAKSKDCSEREILSMSTSDYYQSIAILESINNDRKKES